MPIGAYDAIDRLATEHANRKYGGSIESEFGTKKCIGFFESDALHDLASKVTRSKSRAR